MSGDGGDVVEIVYVHAEGLCPDCDHQPGSHHDECSVSDCGCDRSSDDFPVLMHTRMTTTVGPDFCRECSEDIYDWVQWPCDVARAAADSEPTS